MSLVDVLAAPSGGFDVVPGFADVYPNVKIAGLVQPAVWLCDYALPGEPVIVGLIRKPDAPAQCLVLGRVGAAGPVEGMVSAAPAGSDTITVTADSVGYVVTFLASYAPVVGDRVRLMWQGGSGTVLGKVGVTPAPVISLPATPPPPPPAASGVLSVVAADSATWSAGYGWNGYYGQNLYQGNGSVWGAPAVNNGAWFYSAGASQLAGASVSGVEFYLPARRSGGASSASVTAHLYLHTNGSRPAGDVNRTAGPVNVTVPPGFGGAWISLPADWGAALVAGGGVGISGDPYTGFQGRGADPTSGQLKLSWQR